MLVPMSFVAPCRKRTLQPTNFLTNSTGRHKAHVRLYECRSGVCCMQQLPLSLCLSLLHSVLPAELAPPYACISVRSCVGWLENRKAFGNVYWRQYRSLLICLAVSAKKNTNQYQCQCLILCQCPLTSQKESKRNNNKKANK